MLKLHVKPPFEQNVADGLLAASVPRHFWYAVNVMQKRKLGILNFTAAAGMDPNEALLLYLVAAADPQDPVSRCMCAVLRCAALCCAVLCCAVLCCAVLCCAVLCCDVLCCAVLCCAVLSAVLYCILLHTANLKA